MLPKSVKNPVLLLALAFLLTGSAVSYFDLHHTVSPTAFATNTSGKQDAGDDVDFGSVGTVQGVHTSQDPGAGANQQNNLNGNSSGGSAPLSVNPPTSPSPEPIPVEPDPLPIIPVSPCKYLLESSQNPCYPTCNPCGGMMRMCPLYEGSSQVRYPCSPCGYQPGVDIACRIDDGTPVGQL